MTQDKIKEIIDFLNTLKLEYHDNPILYRIIRNWMNQTVELHFKYVDPENPDYNLRDKTVVSEHAFLKDFKTLHRNAMIAFEESIDDYYITTTNYEEEEI